MFLVLLLFTAGSFAAFSYCAVTPSIPLIGFNNLASLTRTES